MAITKEQLEGEALNTVLEDDAKQLRALLPLLNPTKKELEELTILAIKMKKLEVVRALMPYNDLNACATSLVLLAIEAGHAKILRATLLGAIGSNRINFEKVIVELLRGKNAELVVTFLVAVPEELIYENRQRFFNWGVREGATSAVKELFKTVPPLHIETENVKMLVSSHNKDLRWLLARKGKTEWLHDALQQAACAKQQTLITELVGYFKQIGFTAKRVAGFQIEAKNGRIEPLLKMLKKPQIVKEKGMGA